MTCLTAPAPLPSWQVAAAGRVSQVTVTLEVAAQPALLSPSETVSVMVTGPGAVQVNRVSSDDASVKTPEVAVQVAVSGDGPLSASCALAARPTAPPTNTSVGLASSESICGQTFTVPLTETLPVRGAWWQVRGTVTDAVCPAVTLKVPEPAQLSDPSVETPVSVIV